MKKVAFVFLFALVVAGLAFAQGLNVEKVAGQQSINLNAQGQAIPQTRYGPEIWHNTAITAWWSGPGTGYINLDWGQLVDQGNMLPDEVIDGFMFTYGTNNMDPAGEDFAVYYFDSCTGWGNMGVQESGFLFTGLPNAYTYGSLQPGWGWVVSVTVDLEGSGYEFLLGTQFGDGLSRLSVPTMGGTGIATGAPGNAMGNGFTGTEDAFDTYYPNGVYENTWYFGGYPPVWATFPGSLFGAQDPAANTMYGGIGAQGNDASLYTLGDWSANSSVDFLLRKNQMALPGWLLASLNVLPHYYPAPLDITLFLKMPFVAQLPMVPDYAGDFDRYTVNVGAGIAGLRIYLQGAITAFGPIAPVDLSEAVATN